MIRRPNKLIDQLHDFGGKAEIVNGEIVHRSPAGWRHNRKSLIIVQSLLKYEEDGGVGTAFGDNAGFLVDLPHRQSFSPDVAWLAGEGDDDSPDFIDQPPTFAVEMRSKNEYGPAAERAIREKIADYFAAGTLVVWDVDLDGDVMIRSYVSTAPNHPLEFSRGQTADAEPAVPGWRFEVDDLL